MELLKVSILGAILIGAIILIRAALLNRLPKKTITVLWSIALCRLLIPFSLPAPVNVYTLADQIGDGILGLFSALTTRDTMTALPLSPIIQVAMISDTPIVSEGLSAMVANAGKAVWIIGMFACALFFIIVHLRCSREYKMALPAEHAFIKEWLCKQSIKRRLTIRQSDKITVPLTYGVINPVILLPKWTDYEDVKTIQYVLAHEMIHIKNFDLLKKWFLLTALCIHWFNPLVWIMYMLFIRDLEHSCDEEVVRSFGREIRFDYALTLIEWEERKITFAPLCNHFSQSVIENRIKSIMQYRKKSFAAIIISVLLIVGTSVTFGFESNGKEGNRGWLEMFNIYSSTFAVYPEDDNTLESESTIVVTTKTSISTESVAETTTGFEFKTEIYVDKTPISISTTGESEEKVKEEMQIIINALDAYENMGLYTDAASGILFFEGSPVRYLEDSVINFVLGQTRPPYYLENMVDVIAVYKEGKMIGLRKAAEEEYNSNSLYKN